VLEQYIKQKAKLQKVGEVDLNRTVLTLMKAYVKKDFSEIL
jgi:hypothetical protein